MSTILVVEPYRMLQRAFAAALPFDHKVRATETLPDGAAVKDVELVIVDAAALFEKGLLPAGAARAAEAWKVPTLWIEKDGVPAVPSRDKLIGLTQPVQKDALLKTVVDLLATAAEAKPTAAGTGERPAAKGARRPKARSVAAPVAAEANIIELVDVVEETVEQGETPT